MSDLPDLDTDNIGFVAFWNAIDAGEVASIKPEEILSDPNVEEYTLYDNGVHVDKYVIGGVNIELRAKTDGWLVAMLDSGDDYSSNNGFWDVAWNWRDAEANATLNHNRLSRAIESAASELENWGSVTWDSGDVGLYNYDHPDADEVTMFSLQATNGSADLSYTTTTEILTSAIAAACYDSDGGNLVEFEGTTILDSDGINVEDPDDLGLLQPAEDLNLTLEGSNFSGSPSDENSGMPIFVWKEE